MKNKSDSHILTFGNSDWERHRSQFPVAEKYIYFNNAAIAPISLVVKKEINECMKVYCEKGIVCNRHYLIIADQARKLAADLINSNTSEITFIKNTTQGIQIIANGIRWQNGDNILIPVNEFPANVYPWLNLIKRGVEVRYIPVREGKYSIEDISQIVDKRTRAISVSAVSFTNGFRPNLDEIGRFCKERDIFFIVDAIQALGASEVNVNRSKIDFLATDSHKWLLGPQGIGFAYISRNILDKIDISNMGYKSMVNESDYLNYNIRLKPDASRFEEGTLNIFGIAGMKASLEMILNIGIAAIEKRICELNDILIQNLDMRGYRIISPLGSGERSGIISFNHSEIPSGQIYEKLYKEGVVCAQRDGAIRISPHFYNNFDDIDLFLDALPGF